MRKSNAQGFRDWVGVRLINLGERILVKRFCRGCLLPLAPSGEGHCCGEPQEQVTRREYLRLKAEAAAERIDANADEFMDDLPW